MSSLFCPVVFDQFKILVPALVEFMHNPINRAHYTECLLILLQIICIVPNSAMPLLISDDVLSAFFVTLSHIFSIFDIKGVILVLEICRCWLRKSDLSLRVLFVRHGVADQIRALATMESKCLSFDRIRFSMRQTESLRQFALDWHDEKCAMLARYISKEAATICSTFFNESIYRESHGGVFEQAVVFANAFQSSASNKHVMTEFSNWLTTFNPTPFELFKSGLMESMLHYFLSKEASLQVIRERLIETYLAFRSMPSGWQALVNKFQSLIDCYERLSIFASGLYDANHPLSSLRVLAQPVRVQLTEIDADNNGSSGLCIELTLSPLMTMKSLEPYIRRFKAIKRKIPRMQIRLMPFSVI